MSAVTLKELSKTYLGQDHPALDRFSLELPAGEITALLGPSGCGKTTLLKLVAGLLRPSGGDVLFDGESVLGVPPERRDAVLVFQDHLLFPYMDVADNVGFGLRMRGMGAKQIASEVDEALEMVRLPGFGPRQPAELSGGQRQRVALARSLVVKPKILLLDEPLSNLDAHLRLEMRDLIVSLQRQTRVTCAVVTHDQQEAVEMAKRIALVMDGRLLQAGAAADFYQRPASAAVAKFFGAHNIYPCTVEQGRVKCCLGEFEGVPHADGVGTGKAQVVVRSEHVGIDESASLRARIEAVDYLGTACRVRAVLPDGGKLLAMLPPERANELKAGEETGIALDPARLWVMPS